jgi:hypothetical protein
VRVEGLETLDYLDNLQDRARFTEQGDAIVFESEVRQQSFLYTLYPIFIALLLKKAYATFYSWTEYIWAPHQKLPLLITRRKEHLL